MAFLKRIFFFSLVNILVIATISIVGSLLGAFFGIDLFGSGYGSMLIFAAIFGMGGSFISLMISKWMAKRMYRLQMIDPGTQDHAERKVLDMVYNMSRNARLPKMPEVGIYQSPEMNAFATGPSKAKSLVAVSSGLVNSLDNEELEAVIGHEVAHIANGDMVTLTLIQGVINTFVIFVARIVANIVASQVDDKVSHWVFLGVNILAQILFGILGSMVVAWFSRKREFRADAGGAKYSSRQGMISALQKLGQQTIKPNSEDTLAAFKVSGASGMAALFMTHPPLEKRIAALQRGR